MTKSSKIYYVLYGKLKKMQMLEIKMPGIIYLMQQILQI